jgi:hypothetical protein
MAALAQHSDVLAATIAQIVPVLLLAGVAVPLRLTGYQAERPKALMDLVATGTLVGASALTEFAALFGVWHGGLTSHDRQLVTALLAITGLVATVRVLTPVARDYVRGTSVPEGRVWLWLSLTTVGAFAGLLVLLN